MIVVRIERSLGRPKGFRKDVLPTPPDKLLHLRRVFKCEGRLYRETPSSQGWPPRRPKLFPATCCRHLVRSQHDHRCRAHHIRQTQPEVNPIQLSMRQLASCRRGYAADLHVCLLSVQVRDDASRQTGSSAVERSTLNRQVGWFEPIPGLPAWRPNVPGADEACQEGPSPRRPLRHLWRHAQPRHRDGDETCWQRPEN